MFNPRISDDAEKHEQMPDWFAAMLVLASEGAPTRTTLCAGAGGFEAAHITLTRGVYIGDGADAPEQLAARLAEVLERTGEVVPGSGAVQGANEMRLARGAA